jgi:hypothetical protein
MSTNSCWPTTEDYASHHARVVDASITAKQGAHLDRRVAATTRRKLRQPSICIYQTLVARVCQLFMKREREARAGREGRMQKQGETGAEGERWRGGRGREGEGEYTFHHAEVQQRMMSSKKEGPVCG